MPTNLLQDSDIHLQINRLLLKESNSSADFSKLSQLYRRLEQNAGFSELTMSDRYYQLAETKLAEEYYNLAFTQHQEGKLRQAFENYKKSLALKPHNINLHLNIAEIYRLVNDLTGAIKAYDYILDSLDPKNFQAYLNRAKVKLSLNHHQKAAQDIDAAINTNPSKGDLFECLAYKAYVEGDYKTAWMNFHMAIEFKPNQAELQHYRTSCFALSHQQQQVQYQPLYLHSPVNAAQSNTNSLNNQSFTIASMPTLNSILNENTVDFNKYGL